MLRVKLKINYLPKSQSKKIPCSLAQASKNNAWSSKKLQHRSFKVSWANLFWAWARKFLQIFSALNFPKNFFLFYILMILLVKNHHRILYTIVFSSKQFHFELTKQKLSFYNFCNNLFCIGYNVVENAAITCIRCLLKWNSNMLVTVKTVPIICIA